MSLGMQESTNIIVNIKMYQHYQRNKQVNCLIQFEKCMYLISICAQIQLVKEQEQLALDRHVSVPRLTVKSYWEVYVDVEKKNMCNVFVFSSVCHTL